MRQINSIFVSRNFGRVPETLSAHISDLRTALELAKEQQEAFKGIRKGTLIHTDDLHIRVARDGVGSFISSNKPALLKYWNWAYQDDGFTLEFNILATMDPVPYSPPYLPMYSGKQAHIRVKKNRGVRTVKIIPPQDLPLYTHYPYKTELFEKLLKGV